MEPELNELETQRAAHRRIRAYRVHGSLVHSITQGEAAEHIRARLADAAGGGDGTLVWLDILAPGEEEGEFLRGMGIHQLAVEDCLRGRQRPKVDRFGSHLLLVCYAAHINLERNRVAFTELHLLVGAGFLITVHDHSIPELRSVLARWRTTPTRYAEVGQLAHAVVDNVVDNYFPILEHFSGRVAELETEIFEADRQGAMQDILGLRRELVLFRRVVGPERDMIGDVLRRDLPFFNPELVPYFMDVRDHIMRIAEELDVLRDLLAASLEGHLAISSNQLNMTVRMMTAWSIILMTMAVVAGVYGMNFRFMPELDWRFGYPLALLIMLGAGGAIWTFFKRRGWI
jgi:magnesium transporter